MPAIMWFRHDLRLEDNPALVAAAQSGRLVAVFVHDPAFGSGPATGPNRQAFLRESLQELSTSLEAHGVQLLELVGEPATVLPELAQAMAAQVVHATAGATPHSRRRDQAVAQALEAAGSHLELHPGLWAIDHAKELVAGSGRPYQVFTPFYKAWLAQPRRPILAVPKLAAVTPPSVASQIKPAAFSATLPPPSPGRLLGGRTAALGRLQEFLAGPVHRYVEQQNSLEPGATSRLSQDLHFGLLSPREIEAALPAGEGPEAFRRQLAWRDFYLYVLAHFPGSRRLEFQARYHGFAWRHDETLAEAWRTGQTGYPIIDSAMRQLLAEGFMPNRARLIVGSFLTKDLGLDWRLGESHFRYWLTDGDVAANVGNWQWIASVGVDPAPVFRRLYNPMTQQERYDPTGSYVRRHVPELAGVPLEHLAQPWRMTQVEQEAAGCVIGRDYPAPIVDHALAREAALERYRSASQS